MLPATRAPVLLSLVLCLHGFTLAAETRPNILLILVDDQSPFDLKVYDPKSPLETPNIDRLAVEGMVFDGAYHMGSFSGAVCSPSRHMIMSGRTVWRLPNAPGAIERGKCPPNLEQQTLPAVFNRAGYATMRTCKIGNSYEAANKLFQVRHDATKRGGDDQSGSAWHAEQVLDYLRHREERRRHALDSSSAILASPRHPRRQARTACQVRRVNHADPGSLPGASQAAASCRQTAPAGAPASSTATTTSATKWPSAAYGSGATK